MKARLIKKFEDEIQALNHELKLELPKEIKRARELGDLRENAEYHAAKERQRFVETRISMLRQRVAEIQLMNLERIPHDRAGFGSKLTVVENGKTFVYELVMPEDASPERGLISIASPVGRAFNGKQEGDEVEAPTPAGTRAFEIVKLVTIHHEHEET
jgi:transcription elongation factor GreA